MSWKDLFPKENRYFETDNGILYCGDCLEIIPKFSQKKFDAIITDPPYGTTACKWDSIIPFDNMWKELKRIRKDRTPIVLFGCEPFSSLLRVSNLKEYKYDWIWIKNRTTNFANSKRQPLRNVEVISVFYKKQSPYNPQGVIKVNKTKIRKKPNKETINTGENDGSLCKEYVQEFTNYPKQSLIFNVEVNTLHPTQKPLKLLEYLIKTYTNEGDLVLDFTCGSGTTLVACEKLNRRWVGIEIDEKYCEIAKQRILEVI